MFSLNRPLVVMSLTKTLTGKSVCLSTLGNPASRPTGDLWSKSVLQILAYLCRFLPFCSFNDFLRFEFFWVVGFLQTSLLCIGGELAGPGGVRQFLIFSDEGGGRVSKF